MLRHDASPRIVLPTSPPIGIPFPFDVGFASEAGRVTISDRPASTRGDGLPAVRVGALRAGMIFDPWRSGKPGRSLEPALGARYDIDAYATARAGRALPGICGGSAQGRAQCGAFDGGPRSGSG